jgi:hypothetical protein
MGNKIRQVRLLADRNTLASFDYTSIGFVGANDFLRRSIQDRSLLPLCSFVTFVVKSSPFQIRGT